MSGYALIPSRRMFTVFTFLAFALPAAAATDARLSETYGKLPLHLRRIAARPTRTCASSRAAPATACI